MGRWTTTAEAPSEQTFEHPAYSTAVVQNEPHVSEARRQVQHAEGATRSGWTVSPAEKLPPFPKGLRAEPGENSDIRPICSPAAKAVARPTLNADQAPLHVAQSNGRRFAGLNRTSTLAMAGSC